ncbi:GntR family transcriptional regulator [Nocardia sp. NPDC057030]|uniref:GntR family transcriptional regulator n=1 Tax=unclassified Nocardia TaxID=2637762 RepID=UPI003642D90B
MTRATAADSAQSVYATLRSRLSAGRYAPGDRLAEVELAEELGVSRTPVREALQRLNADGLVARAGRSAVVAGLSDKERRDLFRVRAVLERLASESAARRQRDGELAPVMLKELRRKAKAIEDAVDAGDPRIIAQRNFEFHRHIVEAADNAMLADFLGRVWDRIAVSAVSNLADPAWASTVSAQHQAIVDAIFAGDSDAAGEAMTQHIHAAADATADTES